MKRRAQDAAQPAQEVTRLICRLLAGFVQREHAGFQLRDHLTGRGLPFTHANKRQRALLDAAPFVMFFPFSPECVAS